MSFPFFSSESRLSRRIVVGAVALLLLLSAAEICSAAEVTFSGNYSIQLPAGWTAELQEDKSALGKGPGDFSLRAKGHPTDISPEEFMEKTIAIEEKKPGYKLIEKGAVKNNPSRKAQLLRYQLDHPTGGPIMFAKYYSQLVEKEVVILTFLFPISTPTKSVKSDIEAIFDSVKVTTAAGKDDSWLTTPAEKSKGDSKAASGENSNIAGKYVKGSDYMELKADGTFSFRIRGESGTGTYTRNGATISLKFGDDDTDDAKLDKDGLVDHQGNRWVKSTAPPASTAPTTPGTPVTFATNCSVEMPAGWTGKAVGTHLEGKGPGGVILDGFSVQGAMSIDETVATLTTMFEKTFQGYKLLDTANVSTKAGAKGKVLLYRHTGKTGPQSELGLCAVIKAADNQIVTLRFAASNTPKLEDSLLNAVKAIYTSLTITK